MKKEQRKPLHPELEEIIVNWMASYFIPGSRTLTSKLGEYEGRWKGE